MARVLTEDEVEAKGHDRPIDSLGCCAVPCRSLVTTLIGTDDGRWEGAAACAEHVECVLAQETALEQGAKYVGGAS
jgi:hypothetical protein